MEKWLSRAQICKNTLTLKKIIEARTNTEFEMSSIFTQSVAILSMSILVQSLFMIVTSFQRRYHLFKQEWKVSSFAVICCKGGTNDFSQFCVAHGLTLKIELNWAPVFRIILWSAGKIFKRMALCTARLIYFVSCNSNKGAVRNDIWEQYGCAPGNHFPKQIQWLNFLKLTLCVCNSKTH